MRTPDEQPTDLPNSIPLPKRDRTIEFHVHVHTGPPITGDDLCRVGAHRPAYLARGGIACGYCGTPM